MPEKILRELKQEIRAIETADQASREKLSALDESVSGYLKAGKARDKHRPVLAGALREAAGHFEVSHPKLTDLMNQILTALSNMGI